MSIRLEWDINLQEASTIPDVLDISSGTGWTTQSLIKNAAIILVFAISVLVGILFRQHLIHQHTQTMLEAAIATETTALRLGDKSTYMALQADVSTWQRLQERNFYAYQALGDRVQLDGNVLDIQRKHNEAWVTLQESMDGQIYTVTWFYTWDDGQWSRTPPPSENSVTAETNQPSTGSALSN